MPITKDDCEQLRLVELIAPAAGCVSENKYSTPDGASDAPHVLLVEDNNIALLALENLINQAGCRFTSVMTGEAALDLAKHQCFDLIITDLGLPGLSGFGLTQELRAFENKFQRKPVPIIGLTAYTEKNIKQECEQAGMNHAFIKPMKPSALATIKNTYLSLALSPSSSSKTWVKPIKDLDALGADFPDNEEALFKLDVFCLLDIARALITLGNNTVLLTNLLRSMIEVEIPADLQLLQQAYSVGDWDTLEKIVHRMKDGFAYCGTVRLVYACQYLERYHKAGHTQLLELLYKQLIAVVAETTIAVNAWLLQ